MTQLSIITGASPNVLLDHMERDWAQETLSPFDNECIVVQSLGMERWVRQQLARRRGCAASLHMPFPAAFCRTLATNLQQDPSFAATSSAIDPRFDETSLTWRLHDLLQQDVMLADHRFTPLRDYLVNATPAKRFGLAQRLAARFDEYRLYRPELLLEWERGSRAPASAGTLGQAHADWQAALWRVLVGDEQPVHFARWFTATVQQLETITHRPRGLPERIVVFGISTLPPLFIRLLHAVARFVPVRFYVLVPDAHSWQPGAPRHPVFEGLGHASRELLSLLVAPSSGGHVARLHHAEQQTPHADAPRTLLHSLQRDLRAGHTSGSAFPLRADDRSFTVQVCHSPQRELEVLRDQILDACAADPTLRPHDILVMVPDVEMYAPLAEATFAEGVIGADGTSASIPFRIADRALLRDAAPARALQQLLDLVTSRVTATQVIDLLSLPPVRRAAHISASQLDAVVRWVDMAGIRWGRDGASRATQYQLPDIDDHSWRQGLDRLLAGYAAGRTNTLIDERLPVAGDVVGDTALLGAFIGWVEALFDRLERLQAPQPLAEWSLLLTEITQWLVAGEGADDAAAIDRVLREVRALAELPTANAPVGTARLVDFTVVRSWLTGALNDDEHAAGFLVGGLTVCAMKPMRAIPHRFIAMLGLDDTTYPRRQRRAAFDIMATDRRAGDRDPRADDKQLVLDTLLCAGDRLLLSYVGRSQKNNAEIAPSIVVAQLLDHVDSICSVPQGLAREHVRIEHKLQPFSPAYFERRADVPANSTGPYFSFDTRVAASVLGARQRHDVPPLLAELPPVPALVRPPHTRHEAHLDLTLEELLDAWTNPAKVYCTRVLRLNAQEHGALLDDVEPMAVDALLRTRTQQRVLERALHEGTSTAQRSREAAALDLARGELPPAQLGREWHAHLSRQLEPLLLQVGTPAFQPPLSLTVSGADWTLQGTLDHQLADGQLRVRAATLKARDRIRAWIMHVARSAMVGSGVTRLVATDQTIHFAAVANAADLLDAIVQGARHLRQFPMPYFPDSAAAYREAVRKGRPGSDAARQVYEGNDHGTRGESADAFVALLWRGRDPLHDCWNDFTIIADTFWTPLEDATITPAGQP